MTSCAAGLPENSQGPNEQAFAHKPYSGDQSSLRGADCKTQDEDPKKLEACDQFDGQGQE